ncbi:ATP-dependent DNA helicase RecG [Candidatus Saccharibacteria bacterium]|nr:ATP-dependent DNA helicase RecG [Candidatus Saccharibacteria bacterium]
MRLDTSLEQIKGVGPVASQQFAAAGLHTVGDLITFLPFRHEDYSHVALIDSLEPGKATIKGVVEKVATRQVKRGMRVTTATIADSSGKVQAVWFNQPYRQAQLETHEEFLFSGEFEFRYNRYQLTNSSVEKPKELQAHTGRVLPVYHQIKGLKNQLLRKILREVYPIFEFLPETLPRELVEREGLVSYGEALRAMHFPSGGDDIARARERLAFEELFGLLLASAFNKNEQTKLKSEAINFDAQYIKSVVESLPFKLTNAQRRAAWDIFQDLERDTPMNRLVQGDVGSGKTVVASLAACLARYRGYQSAIMAPTEILASQHAETLAKLLTPFNISVGLLSSRVKGLARKELYAQIETGSVDVVVGTHALIQESVRFKRLGLAVIDEQHRFGVAQRQLLLDKAKFMPHLLALTATPIPRSLALTLYGELDSSIINERPAGRKEIISKIWSPISAKNLYEQVDREFNAGRQGYVICPLIDDNPDNDKKSVEAEYKRLKSTIFTHRSIGLLHGKMKPEEKQEVMEQFSRGEITLLVSTTVVEVGVDVPNATVMIIENADHFGLSQLHQLRGRVGRGVHQSYCYFVLSDSKKPSERLKELERSNDGFYLAEVDLRLRGPGEIYGRMQHGALNLKVATLHDAELIARAQKAAKWFMESTHNVLDYNQLHAAVAKYQRITTLN